MATAAFDARVTYAASTNGLIASPTAANGVGSIAYLFHPSSSTKRVEILRITASWAANAGLFGLAMRGNFISAENGTPGGTSQSINALEQSDAASALTFRTGATGAPTRTAGDLLSVAVLSATGGQAVLFDYLAVGKPLVLRPSVAEGFEVRAVIGGTSLTAAVNCSVQYFWVEV